MTDWEPRNPRFADVVRESFSTQGLMSTYDAVLAAIEPGAVSIEVPFARGLSQQHGLFHGGVTAAVVDSACGYAALTLMAEHSEVVTVTYTVNLLAPAQGVRLVAQGRVTRPGKTLTVCRGEAYVVDRDGRETHCATMTATMTRLDSRP